jgi:hypothetical protein
MEERASYQAKKQVMTSRLEQSYANIVFKGIKMPRKCKHGEQARFAELQHILWEQTQDTSFLALDPHVLGRDKLLILHPTHQRHTVCQTDVAGWLNKTPNSQSTGNFHVVI